MVEVAKTRKGKTAVEKDSKVEVPVKAVEAVKPVKGTKGEEVPTVQYKSVIAEVTGEKNGAFGVMGQTVLSGQTFLRNSALSLGRKFSNIHSIKVYGVGDDPTKHVLIARGECSKDRWHVEYGKGFKTILDIERAGAKKQIHRDKVVVAIVRDQGTDTHDLLRELLKKMGLSKAEEGTRSGSRTPSKITRERDAMRKMLREHMGMTDAQIDAEMAKIEAAKEKNK